MLPKRFWVIVGALVVVLVVGLLPAGCAPKPAGEKSEVVIGLLADNINKYGIAPHKAWIMAIDEINEKGGILGLPIRCVVEYTREGDPTVPVETVVSAVDKLVTRDNVDFIVGTWRSEFAIAARDTSCKYKVISFTGGATGTLGELVAKDYEKYKYAFKELGWGSEKQSLQSRLAALKDTIPMLKETGKPLSFCVLGDTSHYSRAMQPIFKGSLEKLGGEASVVTVPFKATDVAIELEKVRKTGASYTLLPLGGGPSTYAIARQYYDLKIPMPILDSSGGAHNDWDWWELTEGKGRWWGTVHWLGWPPPKGLPRAAAFVKAYADRWGHYPANVAVGGYDTIYSIKAAVEKAQSFDTDALIQALETLKEDELPAAGFPALGWWREDHNTVDMWFSRFIAQWQGPDKMPIVWPPENASGERILKAPYED